MITLQQGTIYLGTAAPASGGGGSGDAVWGDITGTLENQTDLATALAGKQDTLTAGTNITINNGTISATDTTYSAFTGADGSVAGSAGLVPAPAASDNTKFLKGDGTWGVIAGIQNTATGYGALTILGTATNVGYAINIGNGSMITGGDSGVAVGKGTEVSGINGIALGHGAKSMQQYAYQIGMGINNTTKSLAVGFGYNGSTPLEYQLLDGTTGKIPLDRMPYSAGTGVTIGNDGTISASGSVSYDNSTINENSSNQLQTIAVVNKNTAVGATNPLEFWEGTSAEYESGGGSQTWYNWQSGGGLSFIASTLPGTINGGILEYGNGTYLLASTVNLATDGCYISTDNGGSWSNTNIDVSSQYQHGLTVGGIAYGNNTWVITTRNDKYCLYSEDDAQTWTLVNLPGTGISWICAFGNNVFIAIDQFTGECLISSDNGKTWAQGASISAQYHNIFKFCGDKFYALASSTNTLYYTTNGQSWSTITLPASKSWTDIVYGNNKLVISSFDETNNIIYSEDSGQTWNTVSISIKPNKLSFGNNMFVACGNGISTAVYTNDVTNWTSITLPNNASAICYGNNRFVYVNLFNTNAGYGVASVGAECFTTDSAPTTSSQVYSAPNTTSALTITAVGTGTITLSDTNTYNYNASGNQTTSQSVGEAHPDWICMIEGVGIKKGSTTIA